MQYELSQNRAERPKLWNSPVYREGEVVMNNGHQPQEFSSLSNSDSKTTSWM